MADWTRSMQQTFEYYIVDPVTWAIKSRIDNVTSCTIDRDAEASTLGSASFDIEEDIGECYIRVYLVTVQDKLTEKFCLGTFMVQTPSVSFNGKNSSVTMDAYTPLLELKDKLPPIGYTILKETNVMESAYNIVSENVRPPVVEPVNDKTLYSDFVANTSDTWLTFVTDLIANAEYHFELDELSRIIFAPDQEVSALQPVWTYTDDNSSILYPEISNDRDLYGIPNVVQVVYSDDTSYLAATVTNDSENSPTSTVNRGREIVYRETNPSFSGTVSQAMLEEYAKNLMKSKSALEYTLTYTHGYCPVRINDCVRLNYESAGLNNVKAKIISQSISCEPGCPVEETAIYTINLWED